MRRFFISLLVLSLLATAGTFIWKTFFPQEQQVTASAANKRLSRSMPNRRDRRPGPVEPSQFQESAFTLSATMSLISMIATLMSTWFAWRADRRLRARENS